MTTAATPQTRLVWLTDLHLNFVTRQRAELLAKEIGDASPDAVLLGGDLADAPILIDRLTLFADVLSGTPIAFVLGNHDFYHGSFVGITRAVRALCAGRSNLHWLGGGDSLPLGAGTTLVGADGWGDYGHGNRQTRVRLNDSVLIAELRDADDPASLCEGLGRTSADGLCAILRGVRTPKIIVLSHVPPFPEAALYQGKLSGADYAPFFICKATGDVLQEEAREHPERNYLVLCGHTHEACEATVLPNLRVWTGGAEYRRPGIQRVFEV